MDTEFCRNAGSFFPNRLRLDLFEECVPIVGDEVYATYAEVVIGPQLCHIDIFTFMEL